MLGTIWPTHALAPYHDDMLIVRLRSSAPALEHYDTPGLTALSRHERAGPASRAAPRDAAARPAREAGPAPSRGAWPAGPRWGCRARRRTGASSGAPPFGGRAGPSASRPASRRPAP